MKEWKKELEKMSKEELIETCMQYLQKYQDAESQVYNLMIERHEGELPYFV